MCLPIAEGVQSCARWCRVGVDTGEHAEGVGVAEGSSAMVERWLRDTSARWPVVFVQRVHHDMKYSEVGLQDCDSEGA